MLARRQGQRTGRSFPIPQAAAGDLCGNIPGTRIERDVAGVVQKQIELNLFVAGTRQKSRIQLVCFRGNQRFVRHAVRVLRLSGLGSEKRPQHQAILLRRLLPVLLNRVPTLAETFFIRVAILRDDRRDSLRVRKSQAKADRSAIIPCAAVGTRTQITRSSFKRLEWTTSRCGTGGATTWATEAIEAIQPNRK
jgi:hypothetical protein